jgi:hypothetical protein
MDIHSTTEISEQPGGWTAVVTISLITMRERDPLEVTNELFATMRLPDTPTITTALMNPIPTETTPRTHPYEIFMWSITRTLASS